MSENRLIAHFSARRTRDYPMNILFISEHALHVGGVGAVVQQICIGLQQAGYRCYLYTPEAVPEEYGDLWFDGVYAGPLAAPARLTDLRQHRANRQAFKALRSVQERWHIDLVHCQEIHRSLYTACHGLNLPIIGSSHGGLFHKRYRKKRVVRAYRRVAGKISCITVLNSLMADTLNENFGSLFKVVVIPNGITAKWLQTNENQKKDILLGVGRMSEDKRYELAVDAYAGSSCRQEYPLVIAGDGECEQQLIELAGRHGINICRTLPQEAEPNTLYLPGYHTGDTLLALFSRARLFVHPSRTEAFPIVLLEALGQKALPICADLPTYHSCFPAEKFNVCYVSDFEPGNWASTIERCHDSPDLPEWNQRNHAAVSALTWDHIQQQYLECYRAALSTQSAPR